MNAFAVVVLLSAVAALVAVVVLRVLFRSDASRRRWSTLFVVALVLAVNVAAFAGSAARISPMVQALIAGALVALALPLVNRWKTRG